MLIAKLLPFVCLAMPTGIWIANALLGKRRLHWGLAFTAACLFAYITLIVSVKLIDHALLRELYEFDLDGDGCFSDSEMTAQAKRAKDAVTSYTGRAIAAPINGIPITLVWTTICFLVCLAGKSITRSLFSRASRRSADTSVDGIYGEVLVTPETGNPYQPPLAGRSG
jgi:hypothetical protein